MNDLSILKMVAEAIIIAILIWMAWVFNSIIDLKEDVKKLYKNDTVLEDRIDPCKYDVKKLKKKLKGSKEESNESNIK